MRNVIEKMKFNRFVFSISSGNYVRGNGGTNKVIRTHQIMFNNMDVSYLFICPVYNAVQRSFKINTKGYWLLIIDGISTAVCSTGRIIEIIGNLLAIGKVGMGCFIHHLRGVSIDEVSTITNHVVGDIYFYLHDYYTICENCFLMKNNSEFCGAGNISEKKCSGCISYKKSIDLQEKMSDFISDIENRTLFVVPSLFAKKIWISAYPKYRDKVMVIPHQYCEGEYKDNKEIVLNRPLRIAFVGAATYEKGWIDFVKFARKIDDSSVNAELFHFGRGGEEVNNVNHIFVDFHEHVNAMIEKLREYRIDMAILWSLCPETYSFTFYEAFAANCVVIANEAGGNIAEQVKSKKNGLVYTSIEELINKFYSKEIIYEVNEIKKFSICGPARLVDNNTIVDLILTKNKCVAVDEFRYKRMRSVEKLLMITETITISIKRWVAR